MQILSATGDHAKKRCAYLLLTIYSIVRDLTIGFNKKAFTPHTVPMGGALLVSLSRAEVAVVDYYWSTPQRNYAVARFDDMVRLQRFGNLPFPVSLRRSISTYNSDTTAV